MLLKEKVKIFLNNLRSLPSSTKRLLSLGMILVLVVALPLFVWAIVNQRFDIRERAASGEPPTPTPTSTPICKTGVNSFSVDTPCGTNGFRYMTFKCYDGYEGREGGPTSCKTSETWRSYAEKICEGRSNCPTPEPTPTPIGTVAWSTQWASFSATDYKIQVPDGTEDGRIFRVNPSKPCNLTTGEMVCVRSDSPDPYPQGLHYMTLEVTWFEYDIEMRMFIYLYSDGQRWWSNEIRVYNGQPYPNTEWVYFYGKFFDTPVGQAFTQSEQFRLSAPDPKTNGPVTLSFSNVRFAAFLNYFNPTPTPTPKPTPTTWPSPRPTPTPIPRPTPTVTPIPPQPPNRNPIINTKSLPIAIYGKYYSTEISGYDWNKNDKLSMSIGGLPKGVKNAGCSNFFDKNGRNTITCKISGVPRSTGRHYVSVSLIDGAGGTAYKNFILWVFKLFFLR